MPEWLPLRCWRMLGGTLRTPNAQGSIRCRLFAPMRLSIRWNRRNPNSRDAVIGSAAPSVQVQSPVSVARRSQSATLHGLCQSAAGDDVSIGSDTSSDRAEVTAQRIRSHLHGYSRVWRLGHRGTFHQASATESIGTRAASPGRQHEGLDCLLLSRACLAVPAACADAAERKRRARRHRSVGTDGTPNIARLRAAIPHGTHRRTTRDCGAHGSYQGFPGGDPHAVAQRTGAQRACRRYAHVERTAVPLRTAPA